MKVKIIGHVLNASGKLTGIHELSDKEAERLIRLGAAEPVDEPKTEEGHEKNNKDYNDYKVTELKALLDSKNIEYLKDAKKAELIKLLEESEENE